jgi:polysaccharide export outer membrane protein
MIITGQKGWGSLVFKSLTGISISIILVCFFASCITPKNTYYFQTIKKDTTFQSLINRNGESKIRNNDKLSITINSASREEDLPYNLGSINGNSSYEVNAVDGNISLYKLGNMHVAGLTRKEVKLKIEKDLQPYLKMPVVDVKFINRRVVVLGEFSRVQVIPMPEDNISLFEVLATSGDINQIGTKSKIMIIRESDSGKQVKQINLEDNSIFNSPWYYLHPDDVVYVSPDKEKVKYQNRTLRRQEIFATVSFVLSIFIIVLDRIIR